MANDPNRFAAIEKDWNMGPFYVLVDGNTGQVLGHAESGAVVLYRVVGPMFFENAKTKNQVVRRVTITLIGEPVT